MCRPSVLLVPAVLCLHGFAPASASAQSLPAGVGQTTAELLWDEYLADPDNHTHLPNNSFAGYRRGEVAIPDVPVVATAREFGAVPDDASPDDAAFRAALEAAFIRGGGAVSLDPGTYDLEFPLWVHQSGVVVRGAGRDRTFLRFSRPLVTSLGNDNPNSTNIWSWTGGQVWMGPRDEVVATSFGGAIQKVNDLKQGYSSSSNPWEYWRLGTALTTVVEEAPRGARQIRVGDPSALRPGQLVLLTYRNDANQALLREIGGSAPFQDWEGFGSWLSSTSYPAWMWTVEVAAVDGDLVTLAQPLRVATRAGFEVQVRDPGPIVRESGLEDFSVLLEGDPDGSPYDLGWNGVFVHRAFHSWVRRVAVVNGNNGFHVSAAKNVSLVDTVVRGDRWVHHPYTNRCMSHDVLVERFVIDVSEGSVGGTHGINTEFLSSGNVWSRGSMNRGTFDTHRALPFDFVRTEITLRNEAQSNPGGDSKAGPYSGRRTVHWNVRVGGSNRPSAESGDFVYQPDNHSMGALVGIQGAPLSARPSWNNVACGVMPCGAKGVLVADHGRVPFLPNLHDAMVAERASRERWIHVVEPFGDLVAPGVPVVLRADPNGGSETVAAVTWYVDGEPVGTADTAPWALAWTPPVPGSHVVTAVAASPTGVTWSSLPRTLTAGWRLLLEENDPRVARTGSWRADSLDVNFSGGRSAYTIDAAATMEVAFRGTRIQVISGVRAADSSSFEVYLDDMTTPRTFVSLSRNNAIRQVAFDSGVLPPGTHRLRVRNATGAMGIDAFVVWSSDDPAERGFGPWLAAHAVTPAAAAAGSDLDGNGLPAAVDFVLGNAPLPGRRPAAGLLPSAGAVAGLRFRERAVLPPGWSTAVEWSVDGRAWTADRVVLDRGAPEAGFREVNAFLGSAPATTLFRLRVVGP